jgi:hypothetical protein
MRSRQGSLREPLLATIGWIPRSYRIGTLQLSDRPEREKDTFLTAGIFFSLDKCLLMGDPQRSFTQVGPSGLLHHEGSSDFSSRKIIRVRIWAGTENPEWGW